MEQKKMKARSNHALFLAKFIYHILIIIAIFVLFFATFSFAYQTFSNEPYARGSTRKITIMVKEKTRTQDVANALQKKKLIGSSLQFMIRKHFSDYRNKPMVPGLYVFTQSQGMDDMLMILTGEQETNGVDS